MMVRRRVRVRRSRATRVGGVLAGVLALGVAWYAGAAVALAVGAAPATVDRLTGYRAAVDWLADLTAPTGATRAVVVAGGIVVFLAGGRLALAQLPRPSVPRTSYVLEHAALGTTTVQPRAIERAVEAAVAELGGLDAVQARWESDAVTIVVTGSRPRSLAAALRAAPNAAATALQTHGLPAAEVRVLLRRVRPVSTREVT